MLVQVYLTIVWHNFRSIPLGGARSGFEPTPGWLPWTTRDTGIGGKSGSDDDDDDDDDEEDDDDNDDDETL